MSTEITDLLASLEERVRSQIAAEYHDEELQEYEFENLTVPGLLNMLSYMFSEY